MAVTILVSPSLCQDRLVNYAEALLNNFVQSFEILYGKQYISHNIHNLLHICSDVRIFGPLDNYSAFRFENFMTSIKRLLRKNEKSLQQLIRRYSEIENVHSAVSENNSNNDELYLYNVNIYTMTDHYLMTFTMFNHNICNCQVNGLK